MLWAAVSAVSLAMAARASTSSRVDGLCSTLKTSRVCRSVPDMQKSSLWSIRTGALCVLCLPSPSARTRIYPYCRYVYVWGCTGYCHLGLGNQQDTLIPKLVPAFLDDREIPAARLSTPGRPAVP